MPRPARRNAVRPSHTHRHAGHSKAQCLKIFRRLSFYLDGELPDNACEEIRKHFKGCKNCERFLASFRRSIRLCKQYPVRALSPTEKNNVWEAIAKAVAKARPE